MSEPTRQVDTFPFRDPDTGEDCWAGVRVVAGKILLALSRSSDGDVEVTLSEPEARRLAQAISSALGNS
jgi:hypothetical protein